MSRLGELLELAAAEGVAFCEQDGRVIVSKAPSMIAELRDYRDELARRIVARLCCWCDGEPNPGWCADHDTHLPICRLCMPGVGASRLERDGFDAAGWEAAMAVGTRRRGKVK